MQPITQAICFALETGLNELLPFDPNYQHNWSQLDNKTIAVCFSDLEVKVQVRYQNEVFRVFSESEHPADVTLTATTFDFLQTALDQKDSTTPTISSAIHFEGQVAVGQAFAQCLQATRIDWEEILAQPFGDIAARRLANLVRGFDNWFTETRHASRHNLREYLQEEARILPTRIEVENFYSDLSDLRRDTERLQARIDSLLARTES
ncbi:MAG: SCP2 sterol-binding domain-containing protein [Gammaproteobacteria bacterium]|nr:SCP2 sterol-binding domain-containing protein [Gammaproteobacteria bacterium]NNJ71938.1 hypothetical protein [Enterobacterales bacterium]